MKADIGAFRIYNGAGLVVGDIMGSNLGLNRVITKDFSCTYRYYVRSAKLIVRRGGMPWPRKDTTHYQAQLKGPTMKDLVFCNRIDVSGIIDLTNNIKLKI